MKYFRIILLSVIVFGLGFMLYVRGVYGDSLMIMSMKYPFLSRYILATFFKVYPYLIILPFILFLFRKIYLTYYCFVFVGLIFCFHLLLLIKVDCPKCACHGLLPMFEIDHQVIIFGIIFISSMTYILLPTSNRRISIKSKVKNSRIKEF